MLNPSGLPQYSALVRASRGNGLKSLPLATIGGVGQSLGHHLPAVSIHDRYPVRNPRSMGW